MEIARGAEAVIFQEDELVIKQRISKKYRLQKIDEKLIKQRTRQESRILNRLQGVISVPKIIDTKEEHGSISMEFLKGDKLSDHLDKYSLFKRRKIARLIGKQTALMHNVDIIHGDLTTSNMIFSNNQVYFIDFGLSFIDPKAEHKAVDIHLIRQALEAKHHKYYKALFRNFLSTYNKYVKNPKVILDRLEKVESRGRYKSRK